MTHSLAMSLGQSALVLKEFKINPNGPEYVHIVARKAGLISWLLTMLGVDATTVFRVFVDHIEFQEGSLSGRVNTVMPLSSISIATCGFMKPFVLLVMAGLGVLLALPTFGITLIFSAFCILFYFLRKNLMISVISNSGWPAMICFKRSVIEGVSVNYEQAEQVISIIQQLLMIEASKRNR